jgi:6-phosphogluconolactonase
MKYLSYIGTYTNERKEGIYIFESDAASGEITPAGLVGGIENPTYLNLNRAKTLLYTTLGITALGKRSVNGALAVYQVQGSRLQLLNYKPLNLTPPCYIALDRCEKSLLFAEYTNAVAGVFELNPDGSIAKSPPQTVTHTGSGPNPKRQAQAHAHCAEMTPDNRYVCIVDLGMDCIRLYDYADRQSGLKAVPRMTLRTERGAGPRHIIFHPNGRYAYVINELSNTLGAYRYTGEGFEHIQTLGTLPADFNGQSTSAAVKLNSTGDRIFASNRGHDSIAIFAVDPGTGVMELMNISELLAPQPRDFEFMPGEKFVLVGSQTGNLLQSYSYDHQNGRFQPVHKPHTVHKPVCVKFGAQIGS